MTKYRGIIATLFALLAVCPVPGRAAAPRADYPTKPVRIVVGFAPGGANDVIARLLAQKLNEAWGQSVIVDNRPGASGVIGTEYVARSEPNGYTLLVSSQTSMAVAPSLYAKLPYDTKKDFAPITIPATGPMLLVVNPSLPVKTAGEFIALARTKPGQISFGSGGIGSTPHMAGELFNNLFGVKIVHVPYKGEAPALYDVISGEISVAFPSLPVALQHARSGRVRALGITSLHRFPAAPEFPPLAETGAPGFEVNSWYGLFAPAGTPKPVVARLYADTVRVLREGDGKALLAAQGREVGGQTPEAFAAYLDAELARWGKVVKQAGLKVE